MKKLLLVFVFLIFACTGEDNDDASQEINNTQLADVDGNIYPLLEIADEIWATESLRVKSYRDGTPIPHIQDPIEWESLTTGAWRYVNDDPSTEQKYGLLYNFYAVNNPRGLAPQGARIPSYSDLLHLTSYFGVLLNNTSSNIDEESFSRFVTDDPELPWSRNDYSILGTNSTGFNLYPAGFQRASMSPTGFGYSAFLWSTNSVSNTGTLVARFSCNSSSSNTIQDYNVQYNYYGCSVRVIKNQ